MNDKQPALTELTDADLAETVGGMTALEQFLRDFQNYLDRQPTAPGEPIW